MSAVDEIPDHETSKIYTEDGHTCMPKRVREILGDAEKGDTVVWLVDEDSNSIKVGVKKAD
jgi:hypothetical protein